MSRRWFTADFHLGMTDILRFENRPFSTIDEMNQALLESCFDRASADDVIIHVGDLASFKQDRSNKGLDVKPAEIIATIPATFLNIRGNHDINNKVKSICESMRIRLGKKFPDVSLSHYPSYDRRANTSFRQGDIHICGHVHGKWKHCLDMTNQVLNINVGVDVWKYKIVSEFELIQYIEEVIKTPKEKLVKVKIENGNIVYG